MGYHRLPLVRFHSVWYATVRYDSLGTVRFARCRYHLDARSYCLDPLVCSGHSIDTLLTGQSIDTLIGLVVRKRWAEKLRNHSHQ